MTAQCSRPTSRWFDANDSRRLPMHSARAFGAKKGEFLPQIGVLALPFATTLFAGPRLSSIGNHSIERPERAAVDSAPAQDGSIFGFGSRP